VVTLEKADARWQVARSEQQGPSVRHVLSGVAGSPTLLPASQNFAATSSATDRNRTTKLGVVVKAFDAQHRSHADCGCLNAEAGFETAWHRLILVLIGVTQAFSCAPSHGSFRPGVGFARYGENDDWYGAAT